MTENDVIEPFDLEWLGLALQERGVKVKKNAAVAAIAQIDRLRRKLGEASDEEVLASAPKKKPAPKPSKRQLRYGENEPYGGGWKRSHLSVVVNDKPEPIWTNR